jgi:phosphoesterase RecJ-like protein
MTSTNAYSNAAKFIESHNRILVTAHINPDGDGIGSMLALGEALAAMGKTVALYTRDNVPDNLSFLPGADKIAHELPSVEDIDAAIMVDCGEPNRAGDDFAKWVEGKPIAVIDHHLYTELSGAVMCLDVNAASAGEVAWRVIGELKAKRTAEMALNIYTTLVVDTGFFRYSNTTSKVLALAAELVDTGADPWCVARNLDESHPERRLRLLAKSLETLTVLEGGRYALMDVTQAMFKETGASIADSDEFAPYPRSIDTVEVSALFREEKSSRTKVSLRSKEFVNVAELARRHGGGGHERAAGFGIDLPIDETKELVAKEIHKILK